MERYSLERTNLEFQQNPRKISMTEKFQEKFQMEFRLCWATVYSHISLFTENTANKKMFKVSNRNTRKRCDIKNIQKKQKKSNSLFAGNNCPGPCPTQLFLEYTPICVQMPALNSYV